MRLRTKSFAAKRYDHGRKPFFRHSLLVRRVRYSVRFGVLALQSMWALARLDMLRWLRMPWAIASALLPPLGMALMLVALSLSVTQEPVALVIQSHGAYTHQMVEIIKADTDAYTLSVMSLPQAEQALHDQLIAAIITIPAGFDYQVLTHTAQLRLTLNNVDIDFSDDIRRAVDRSVSRFDAASLPAADSAAAGTSNPYLISIDEHTLRTTNVSFLSYQVLPVFVLLVLHLGLMGTALLCALDRERRTARHLVMAPVSSWVLVAGRLLGSFCVSCLVVLPVGTICTLVGIVAPPATHWPALIALLVATAANASGMGTLLGTLLHRTRTIALAASLLATCLFFLGGGFTTIAFLPQWLQLISAFNPIRYAIDGMRQALFYPDLAGFSTDLTVLVGAALVTVLVGALAVRRSWAGEAGLIPESRSAPPCVQED